MNSPKGRYSYKVLEQKDFLIANAVIVILFVAYFLTVRKKELPAKLNLKKDKPLSKAMAAASGDGGAIPLNVYFNYNGHSFDAYEALGVPAGSTWEEVQLAFQKNLAVTDPSSQEFYRVALEAVRQATRK